MIIVRIYFLLFFFEIKQKSFAFSFDLPDITRSNYYGMGVEDAWAKGYTGKGVVIGIAGFGVDTCLLDLKDNINTNLSYNFVRNNTDVSAEHFPDRPEAYSNTNYGNNVASIIGAIKDNNICSAGIAFNSTIAVLKIYELLNNNLDIFPRDPIASGIPAQAFLHRLDDIDIVVLTWQLRMAVGKLDYSTREAFYRGVKLGRKGLGRIYVVAAAPIGNEISNNVNTVTVNGMGRYGRIPPNVYRDTSVLTSGLYDGHNLTSEYMFTTASHDECTVQFQGVSAATSQVAAIIALALEANPRLSAHEIQHLIVRSCHVNGLNETYEFQRNGAKRFYHPYFGFGLLNATTLVGLARILHIPWDPESTKHEIVDKTESVTGDIRTYTYLHDCYYGNETELITHVEYVILEMDISATAKQISLMITSPRGTRSLLLTNAKISNGRVFGKLVSSNFWDETAYGEWKLKLSFKETSGSTNATITKLSIELYGTNREQICTKYRDFGGNKGIENKPSRKGVKKNQAQRNTRPTFTLLFVFPIPFYYGYY